MMVDNGENNASTIICSLLLQVWTSEDPFAESEEVSWESNGWRCHWVTGARKEPFSSPGSMLVKKYAEQ